MMQSADARSGRASLAPAVALLALLFVDPRSAAKAQDQAPVLAPIGAPYIVASPLAGKKGDEAMDISGIACLPSTGDAAARCLVINDEGRKAQFVTIEARRLSPGRQVELIGKQPSDATLGAAPNIATCPSPEAEYDDLDGEGVAFADHYFYVAGSHGCSRRKGKFELSSFILARIDVGPSGAAFGKSTVPVQTTYRLADALASIPALAGFFGADLGEKNGLNIEGIAVIGDRLFAGLRAPSVDGHAYLVSVSLSDLFAPGHGPLKPEPRPGLQDAIPLALGKDVGIRDLAPLRDGRLLVLAGPAQEQADVPYSLFVVEPRIGGAVKPLGILAALPAADRKGKAEALAILASGRVLILFDSLPSGGPRDYEVPLH